MLPMHGKSSVPSAREMRQRVAGWRAAGERERQLRRDEAPLEPEEALTQALELCELTPAGFWATPDEVRQREVAQARAVWARLRAASRKSNG